MEWCFQGMGKNECVTMSSWLTSDGEDWPDGFLMRPHVLVQRPGSVCGRSLSAQQLSQALQRRSPADPADVASIVAEVQAGAAEGVVQKSDCGE